MLHHRNRWIFAVLCAALGCARAMAESGGAVPDMSLEELLNTEVTSASRKAQSQQSVAAAVFVITREDIARSGARNLPDLLAMAPGIEVARIGNDRWAVSARGFNGRFANKLQVLKDGRSLYSPLFSGVFWEVEDTVLEDIERIEIIRGPNAASWGSNAVNGTINIVTRKARDTQGGLVAVLAGSDDRGNGVARYGAPLGESGHIRVFGKAVNRRAGFSPSGGKGDDESDMGMAGFRADFVTAPGNRLMLTGGVVRQHGDDIYRFADPLQPPNYINALRSTLHLHSEYLQARFDSLQDDGSEWSLQAYLVHDYLDSVHTSTQRRTTVDLDAQYHFSPLGTHDLIVGINARSSRDSISTASDFLRFRDADREFTLLSVFALDEITLIPERLRISLGARLEHNNFSGAAFQPTARFLWTPNADQTVWGAVSRADRTPSRADMDTIIVASVIPPSGSLPVPLLATYMGDNGRSLRSERMDAAELGYRQRFGPSFSLDTSAFIHRYRDVVSLSSGSVDLSTLGLGYAQLPLVSTNDEHGHIYGLEVAAFAQITPAWRLQPSYTWQRASIRGSQNPASTSLASRDEGKIPRHMLSLRSQHNLAKAHQLDFWLKYKSRIEAFGIPDRANLDVRYAWAIDRCTDLSLVGQNLLHRRTLEYLSDTLPSAPIEIGRGAYLRLEHRF